MSVVYERILPVMIPGARHIDRMHVAVPIVTYVHPLVDVLVIALVGKVAGPLRKLISQEVWQVEEIDEVRGKYGGKRKRV